MRLVNYILPILAVALLGGIAGCRHPDPSAPAPITLLLDWRPEPEFGGFYQADAGGDFKQQGLNVELRNAGEGAPTWQLVASGQADFATTSADLLVQGRAQGADVVALFAVYQTSPQGIMVHAARKFTSIGDVFTHPGNLGAEPNPWLDYLRQKYPSPAVKVVADPNGLSLFMNQPDFSQQCFVTSEPLEARHLGGDAQTFLIADAGFNPYVTVLITSGKTLREKPDVVNKMVAACRAGWRRYLDDPKPANEVMSKLNSTMTPATFAEVAQAQKPLIETDDTRKNGLGTMTADRWNALIDQLVQVKAIGKAITPAECFVNPK